MITGKVLSNKFLFFQGTTLDEDRFVERSDSELMLAAAGDDLEAFNFLYNKYRKQLYSYIYRHIRDDRAAEDIFQETFMRLYRNRKNYRPTAKFSVYVYTIAHRLCINHSKKSQRWGFVKRLSDIIFGSGSEDSPTLEETVADENPLPMEEVVKGEMSEVLKKALNDLSENHRTAFTLYELQGFSYQEIAEITGTNIGTVKSRLNTARKKLQEMLKPYLKPG